MIGWWSSRAPVRTDRPDVLATSYVRRGRTMVAVASWARDTVDVPLHVDWTALGLDASRARVHAPAIEHFQPAAELDPGLPLRIAPGRGWLLVLDNP
jgi:hypothetical protein